MMDENGSIRVRCRCGAQYLLVPLADKSPKAVRLLDECRISKPEGDSQ